MSDKDDFKNEQLPWQEKYRPMNINSIIMDKNMKKILTNIINTGSMPHLLFHGSPGTGKTSTILAIAKEIYGENYRSMVLELNASDNRNINVVRDIIKEFASTSNLFMTGYKIIILDEVDFMTYDAQFCLRRIIELYSRNVRFCFICNYIHRIIPAIQSRCVRFRFKRIPRMDLVRRLEEICLEEKINLKRVEIEKLIELSNYDMRKILNYLQSYKNNESAILSIGGNIMKVINMPTERIMVNIIGIIKRGGNIGKIVEKVIEILNREKIMVNDFLMFYYMRNREKIIRDEDLLDKLANLEIKFKGAGDDIFKLYELVLLMKDNEK
jgi:DNA polymerase III delta prime subunit